MNTFNQPPETDIPLALAGTESPMLYPDLTDTKAIKKLDETSYKTELTARSNRPKSIGFQALKIIQFPTPGQNGEKSS